MNIFLLSLFCVFFQGCLFCASFDLCGGEGDFSEEMSGNVASNTKNGEGICMTKGSALFLKILQGNKNKPCSYKFLIESAGAHNNKRRDLYAAVINLRNGGYNIVNNDNGESFTLCDGEREVRQACYQEELWQMLHANNHLSERGEMITALDLSDANLHVDCAGVCAIKTLWKLTFKKGCSQKKLLPKKNAWRVILRDFHVYRKKYYRNHPDVQGSFSNLEMSGFKRMLLFYKDYVEQNDPTHLQLKAELASYMKNSPQGVTLEEIQHFLKDSSLEEIDEWMGIGILMRGGYRGCVSYCEGKFFWDLTPAESFIAPEALIDVICALFEKNTSCDGITFALYKRGVFSVKPFDVRNILDILIEAGCLKPHSGGDDDEGLAGLGHEARCVQILKESDMFWKISEGYKLDIVDYLKTDIYPKYFGWSVPKPVLFLSKSKKRNRDTDLSQDEGAKRRRCLESEATSENTTQEAAVKKRFAPIEPEVARILQDFCSSDFDMPGVLSPPLAEDTRNHASGQSVNPQASESDLTDAPGVPSSGRFSDSEEDSDGSGDTESVKACAQKRQKLLLEYLKQKENEFCSSEELQALYGEQGTKATVLEDAVSLIHSHHNIEYSREWERYRLLPGPWPAQPPKDFAIDPESSCVRFFCQQLQEASFAALNVGEKTYHLYGHGYQSVPLSTVALLMTLGRAPGATAHFSKRERRLKALKDHILKHELIRCAYEYKNVFSSELSGRASSGDVRSEDVASVRKSLELYTDGCAILKKNTKKQVLQNRQNRQNQKIHLVLNTTIKRAFTEKKGQACSAEYLREVAGIKVGHGYREVYRAIVDLRLHKMNIVHNPDGTFTLWDGCRITKTGCYRRVVWHMLDGKDPKHLRVGEIFLSASDLGYDPSWSVVESIFVLKKLCTHSAGIPNHRVAAWDMIIADGVLRDADYYKQNLGMPLDKSDMNALSVCWGLYNRIVYNLDVEVAQQTKELLENNVLGTSLKSLERYLFANWRKGQGRKINVWNTVSGLMRGGYAGQIDLIGDTVFWRSGAPNVVQTNNDLFSDFRSIPLGYEYGPATVFLHKRGHLNVSPWDVAQLLDIFAFLGYREQSRKDVLTMLWTNRGNGREYIKGLAHKEAVFLRRMQWLQSTTILEKLQKSQDVNLQEILNSEEWISESEEGVF